MSWTTDAATFGKKLLFLSEQVTANAKAIEKFRQDFDELERYVGKMAGAVQVNRSKLGEFQSWVDLKNENTYLKMKDELREFERRMNALNQADSDSAK